MAETVEILNRWSETWIGLAWAVTWQSAVLIGLAALVAVLLRRAPPGLRYWLWQIVAIKVLLMPFWTMAIPLPFVLTERVAQQTRAEDAAEPTPLPGDDGGPIAEAGSHSPEIPPPVAPQAPPAPWTTLGQVSWQLSGHVSWKSWLMIGWGLVVAAQFAFLAWQRLRLRRLLRAAALAPEPLQTLVGELAGQIGLRRVPRAVVTEADCSFFVCGVRRPVLVLPRNLLAALGTGERTNVAVPKGTVPFSSNENWDSPPLEPAPVLEGVRLRQVLLHELAHVRRLDLLFGWPVEIARRLYFFHPLVHWLAYRLRLERELACDQVAMAGSGRSPGDYIQTLVHVVTEASLPAAQGELP